jgi:short-subunit dehydrogenase
MATHRKCIYIVTGHSRGVGKEVTKALLSRGDTVFGFSRNKITLENQSPNLNLLKEYKWDFSQNVFSAPLQETRNELKKFSSLVFILNAAKNTGRTDNPNNFLEDLSELIQINFTNQILLLNSLIKDINFERIDCLCVGSYSSFLKDNQSSVGYILSKNLLGDLSVRSSFSGVKNLNFKTIFFAGIATGMYEIKLTSSSLNKIPLSRRFSFLFRQTPEEAAAKILKSLASKKVVIFYPSYLAFPVVLWACIRNIYSVVSGLWTR